MSDETPIDERDRGGLSEDLYRQLRDLAASLLSRERPGHTLQPTALVHEAYLRVGARVGMASAAPDSTNDESSFRALAATAMRHILVDHARRRLADKRGGERLRVELPEAAVEAPEPIELLALNEALEALSQLDSRKARVVELRYFGGLSGDETAVALGVARSTVESDWFMARAWLRQRLSGAV
ncbi:MAG: sigma-70 family RNA polymerase sigma factor [Phycisphaerae bacterium]|nr:sigma-70 family RNA polymerase sigma factor [Phycisphaerae bacterium]